MNRTHLQKQLSYLLVLRPNQERARQQHKPLSPTQAEQGRAGQFNKLGESQEQQGPPTSLGTHLFIPDKGDL